MVEIDESEAIEGVNPSTLGFSNIISTMERESKLMFIGLNVAKAAVCAFQLKYKWPARILPYIATAMLIVVLS